MIVVVLGTRFVSYHVALYKQHPEIYKIVEVNQILDFYTFLLHFTY